MNHPPLQDETVNIFSLSATPGKQDGVQERVQQFLSIWQCVSFVMRSRMSAKMIKQEVVSRGKIDDLVSSRRYVMP